MVLMVNTNTMGIPIITYHWEYQSHYKHYNTGDIMRMMGLSWVNMKNHLLGDSGDHVNVANVFIIGNGVSAHGGWFT